MDAPRYVIFDLDHTLIRSEGQSEMWKRALAEVGAEDSYTASWEGAAGRPLTASAAIALGLPEGDPATLALVERFWDHVGDGDPEPLDGAGEVLDALRAQGLTLFLSTGSYPKPVERWLSPCGWGQHFELVLASDHHFPKGPLHYQAIFDHLSIPANEFGAQAVTIGDGVYDMNFGRDHGVVHRIGFSPLIDGRTDTAKALEAAGATVVIRSLRDLPALIARLGTESAT